MLVLVTDNGRVFGKRSLACRGIFPTLTRTRRNYSKLFLAYAFMRIQLHANAHTHTHNTHIILDGLCTTSTNAVLDLCSNILGGKKHFQYEYILEHIVQHKLPMSVCECY